jgi:hypothetical protein
VCILTSLHQESHSGGAEDSLFHGEPLLVVTAGNLENVAIVLFSHDFSFDLLTHSPVIEVATRGALWGKEGGYIFFSSSISIFFLYPDCGQAMLNYKCLVLNQTLTLISSKRSLLYNILSKKFKAFNLFY